MKVPFASQLLVEIAPLLGYKIELEPEFGFVGEIIFPDGKRHLFKNTNFNLNRGGSIEIAKDKSYTTYFLGKAGFRVPEGKAFFSQPLNDNLPLSKRRDIEQAVCFANAIGYPVFAKPNNLSQGALVALVANDTELRGLAAKIFEKTAVMLIERAYKGSDYRVVVLGSEIISAYGRVPLTITGDGHKDIATLLQDMKDALPDLGRPNAEIDLQDFRIETCLARYGKSKTTVVGRGERVQVLDNANLSTGGTSFDVTDCIHDSFKQIAIKATTSLGLTLAGVDFICNDITKSAVGQNWIVLEVNAAPGLDNYAALGQVQSDRVKAMYKKVLIFLANTVESAT